MRRTFWKIKFEIPIDQLLQLRTKCLHLTVLPLRANKWIWIVWGTCACEIFYALPFRWSSTIYISYLQQTKSRTWTHRTREMRNIQHIEISILHTTFEDKVSPNIPLDSPNRMVAWFGYGQIHVWYTIWNFKFLESS